MRNFGVGRFGGEVWWGGVVGEGCGGRGLWSVMKVVCGGVVPLCGGNDEEPRRRHRPAPRLLLS